MCISLWLLLFIALVSVPQVRLQCSPDRLVLYHVSMKTHWSRELFPKQYPEFRPPAQWSKLVGRSHNSSYSLYRIGGMASEGLKKFAEVSSSDILDEFSQGSTGVYDAFNAPPILQGVGQTETQFFVDGKHPKVSLVARIVPSPDWFVGVDSVDLCMGNEWIETIAIDVDPMDSGTDNGFTFTSPNWPTVPQEAIYHIHNAILHPAHSFHYPERTRNKPMATFTFVKLKEYSLWVTSPGLTTEENGLDPLSNLLDDIDSNDIGNELNEIADPRDGDEGGLRSSKKKRNRKSKGGSRSRDCSVSHWSEWSECSALCGFGEQHRNRYIINHPRGGGAQCPSLTDKRLCSSARDCRQNYFDW